MPVEQRQLRRQQIEAINDNSKLNLEIMLEYCVLLMLSRDKERLVGVVKALTGMYPDANGIIDLLRLGVQVLPELITDGDLSELMRLPPFIQRRMRKTATLEELNQWLKSAGLDWPKGLDKSSQFFLDYAMDSFRISDRYGSMQALREIERISGENDATRWLRAVLYLSAGMTSHASKLLGKLKGSGNGAEEDRFLVIRSSSTGFWADVQWALVGVLLAEITGRIPVIHFGLESGYHRGEGSNVWTDYFNALSDHDLSSAYAHSQSYLPEERGPAQAEECKNRVWHKCRGGVDLYEVLGSRAQLAVIERPCSLIDLLEHVKDGPLENVSELRETWLRLYREKIEFNPESRERAVALRREYLGEKPFLAVHFRMQSSGKRVESLENRSISRGETEEVVAKMLEGHEDWQIYVLSDYAPFVDSMRERFGERVVTRPMDRLERDTAYQTMLGKYAVEGNAALAREVVDDVQLALMAEAFVGDGASAVSSSIYMLGDWNEANCKLMREIPNFHLRNDSVYRAKWDFEGFQLEGW